MSTSTTTGDETADQLRREMAMVRRELSADIKGVTAQAKELTDWRQYMKHAPWISIGIAAAAGGGRYRRVSGDRRGAGVILHAEVF